MAATPYLLSVPSQEEMPSRTLLNGVSDVAIMAGSSADAVAFIKAQHDNDVNVTWDNADAVTIAADSDLNGWKLRVRVVAPGNSTVVADETVEADGVGDGFVKATGTLTLTPGLIADDVVKINTTYYQFAADPTTGTPDGTVGNPYLVDVGGTDTVSLANLRKAINATGTGGVDYSVEIVAPHATVTATASDATTLSAEALAAGTAGNSISTTVTATGGADGLAWGATTLTGGVGATDRISSLALKMVEALNALTPTITAAAWDQGTGVLTVADGAADTLGDHRLFVYVIPADADEDNNDVLGVNGFVSDTASEGNASDNLTVTFESDSYTVPTIVSLLGAAV